MKKNSTGSGDFLDLRKENVICADKTAYMRRLASRHPLQIMRIGE